MNNFTLSFGLDSLEITAQTIDRKGSIIFDVKSTKSGTPCHKCGKLTKNKYGYGETITIRHVSILDKTVFLRIRVAWYQCMDCDDHQLPGKFLMWLKNRQSVLLKPHASMPEPVQEEYYIFHIFQ